MKDLSVLKWIYNSCGRRGREGAALILLNALSAVCVTLFALLSKTVVDCAADGDGQGLLKNAAILLLLILFQMICRICSSLLEAASQGKAEISLKTRVFSDLLYGDYSRVSEHHSGEIMTRLTADVSAVSDNSVCIPPSLAAYVVRLLSAGIALIALDKMFALIFIGCGALLIFVAAAFRKPLKNLHRRVQEKDGKVRSFMQEMTENLFAVKVFEIEDKVINRAGVLQNDLYRQKLRRKSFSVFSALGFSLAFAMGFLAAVSYGSYGILHKTMSFGTVVALIQLVNQLQSPVMGITGILPSFFAMIASAQRLIETVDCGDDDGNGSEIEYDSFEALKAKNLTFGYDENTVLQNADFTVKKGEFVGIKGPSGVGKTTVFKLLTGLYTPQDGELSIICRNKTVSPSKGTRKLFSVVPQGNMLFSGTIKENLTLLSPDSSNEEIETALKTSCAEFVYDLPMGLDTVLSEGGAGISEGQAQRIAVARALLGDGKIILMDEATSALDSETETKLLQNLRSIGGVTVVFITHREAVFDFCDRVITVDNGKIQENLPNFDK